MKMNNMKKVNKIKENIKKLKGKMNNNKYKIFTKKHICLRYSNIALFDQWSFANVRKKKYHNSQNHVFLFN